MLSEPERDEQAQSWLALACDRLVDANTRANKLVDAAIRMSAARTLINLGHIDEAIQTWLALARDVHVDSEIRASAAMALMKRGYDGDLVIILMTLVQEHTVVKSIFGRWVEPKLDAGMRVSAISVLGTYGNDRILSELNQIAQTDSNPQIRTVAHESRRANSFPPRHRGTLTLNHIAPYWPAQTSDAKLTRTTALSHSGTIVLFLMLPHDFDLTSAHLQALSSREAIVAFCAQLGYNTEARLKQTSAALGFSDVLAHEVTHVERVADHENGELQVYLLEMKHVTVALTQALARSLRNRAGNFLLVLTADYERIDFVLMDLVRPEGSAERHRVEGGVPASAHADPRAAQSVAGGCARAAPLLVHRKRRVLSTR